MEMPANDNLVPPEWSFIIYKWTMLFAEHERAMADSRAIIARSKALVELCKKSGFEGATLH